MTIADIKKDAEHKMRRSLEGFQKDYLTKIRTGRAHTGLLDHIRIEYYGSNISILQVANLTLIDANTISVQPWDKKMVAVITKAIRESHFGLNPVSQGELIRVPMPVLTEERRRELSKVVKSEGENAKVVIRNLRRDANDQLKKLLKDKDISEDDERRAQDEVQKLTDKFVGEIEKLVQIKESEIMTV
ncbi:ribosome recycling factor [Candidatus Vallotia lariciata]|uniref:ribosome recycling factor n=1 Tax=Candidatus Vallotia laricis TaxID=2018052 RepID=UPI001D03300F|nr:ribosome recycling factor [Candidatus Vallotia lariciata]UDG83055.1 Ribosome-recycling factor [Candidatus Vallotia lariciata]